MTKIVSFMGLLYFSSLRGNYEIIDEAISGIRYYFMRLPRSLRLLAMTIMVTFILSKSSLSQ
ncbi:hypothetical protein RFEPED_1106 [Rickettsia felis str. Pedreira]|uniref:Uncharacterized protein n=1 Tax=Rickettsia felis str. Pedreira TaxID=1359196 RepID=A0A0F3MVY0_RICFI|nr:hypothetical protein [Rickettsia felis]KJV58714.1 hypothetical protein RFEPED_1106 [Rickettsia felis str. Pedreira]